MSELEPTPELPDKTPTREVRFPTWIKNALFAAGLKTVGEVRETSDEALLNQQSWATEEPRELGGTNPLCAFFALKKIGTK